MNDPRGVWAATLGLTLFVAISAIRLSGFQQPPTTTTSGLMRAVFAGGCFWSMERAFDEVAGVVSVDAGYTGGSAKNPRYELVQLGVTGHAEAVQVIYEPRVVSYGELLDAFWRNIDPTDGGGQFCDRGQQYRPIIFYGDTAQKNAAEASKTALEASRRFKRIVTQILPASGFWRAEPAHQDFYRTHPFEYRIYQSGCGRETRLQALWGERPH
jgi:peptide-methionine (S)-S-oxide reductase